MMVDAKKLLDQLISGQVAGGGFSGKGFDQSQLGGLARTLGQGGFGGVGGGALAGGLAGILLGSKKGRKLGGSAVKLGGLALVGTLAYKAYQNWQSGQRPEAQSASEVAAALPPPRDTPFNPTGQDAQESLARNMLRAMIAAAKADGHIDATEQANIFSKMDELELTADDKAFVMDELRKPLDVEAVAKCARTPEEAAQIYTASLLAIDVDNAAERGYLGLLAARMNLDPALVDHLHRTLESAEKVPVAT